MLMEPYGRKVDCGVLPLAFDFVNGDWMKPLNLDRLREAVLSRNQSLTRNFKPELLYYLLAS